MAQLTKGLSYEGQVIYIGPEAKAVLNKLLNRPESNRYHYPAPYASGYYRVKNNVIIAFDNLTGECFIEQFITIKKARKFLGV